MGSPYSGLPMIQLKFPVILEVMDLIQIFVRYLERYIVWRHRLLLEVFRQSVVLFGESGPEIKVSLAFEDRFALSSKIITGETLAGESIYQIDQGLEGIRLIQNRKSDE